MLFVAYTLKGIVEIYALNIILRNIFDAKIKQFTLWYIASGLYLLITISHLLLAYQSQLNTLVAILTTFFITCSYNLSRISKILACIFSICIALCSEGIVFLATQFALQKNITQLTPDSHLFPYLILLCAVSHFVLAFSIGQIITIFKRNTHNIYLTISIILSILGILSIEMFVTFADTQYMPAAIIAILLVMFCAALCGGLLRDQLRVQQERLRLEFLEQQSADQITHYTALYQHSRDIHKLRHDMKNFILSADSLLQQEQYDALHKHFASFLNAVQPPTLTDTGNPLLDAVLSAKRADAPNIPFHLQIPALSYTHIDPMDVAMLLATALDNAIAGCKGELSPYILVKITQQAQMVSLLVKNPTHQPIITKQNRLISQKANPEQHGYGMQGMERIAQKYYGSLNWNCINNTFELSILLQDLSPAKVSAKSSNV